MPNAGPTRACQACGDASGDFGCRPAVCGVQRRLQAGIVVPLRGGSPVGSSARHVVVFTLPVRLVSEANAHTHWRVRQKRAKAQRAAVYHATLLHRSLTAPYPYTITITRIAPRSLDSDNLVGSAKHARDSIAEALGFDDRDPRVDWRVEQRKGKPKEYAVEIRIEPKEAA